MAIGSYMVYYGLFKWPTKVMRRYYIDLTQIKPEIIEINSKSTKKLSQFDKRLN